MKSKNGTAKWGWAAALFAAALSFLGCGGYNPTFDGFVETALNPENSKGFFSYDIRFPNIDGTEVDSEIHLVSLDRGEDVFGGKRLNGWDDPAYSENGTPYRRLFGTEKIPYGYYKFVVQIANPQTWVFQEKVFFLVPGETYAYKIHFNASDFGG
jgi:hypothetical protein